ncbi:MAG: TonB-dependent receptor [Pseudomonadota bacterium]
MATLISQPQSAFAADDTKRGSVLPIGDDVEEIIVRSTRIPTQLGRVGSAISIIDQVVIEQTQSRFVLDVLSLTPGLSISQFGARGTDSSVRLRGQGGEATLVLIDGVEVSDPSRSQTAFDFSQLTTDNIERVEILRGSQSVLYGGDAVGGVISIESKTGGGPLTGSVLAEYGSFQTYLGSGNIRGGLVDDRLRYSLNVQYLDTDGFSAADQALEGNEEGEDYDNLSSSGRVDFDVTDNLELRGVYRVAEGTLNFDAFGGAFGDDPDRGDDFLQYSGRVSAHFNALDGRLNGQVGAAYARNERDGFNDGMQSYFFYGDRTKFDANATYSFTQDHDVIVGVDIENEAFSSDGDPAGEDVDINGYYAMYQGTIADVFTLSVGGRIDDHELFGSFETYRITGAYLLSTDTRLKGSVSTGFRAPSLFELFGVCCGEALGNDALQPEESESWDVGLEQTLLGGDLRFEAAYFNIRTDNEIVFRDFGNGPLPNYFNVGDPTRSNGVELNVAWRATDSLDVGGAYTYNNARIIGGARLQNRPRHIASAYVNWAFSDGRGNLNVSANQFSDSLDNGSTVVLRADAIVRVAASYDITDQLQLSARIENLLDEQYQTEAGYGTANASAYGGLRYRF